MNRLSPQLAEELDCMSLKDFFQYYKTRYFGIKSTLNPNTILPAYINSGLQRDETFAMALYDDKKQLGLEVVNWKRIKEAGRFGCPLLGTTLVGPTYTFFMGHPYRESLKGISLGRCDSWLPNYEFIAKKYVYINPALGKMLGGAHSGRNFGSKEEMETVYNIYNKTYYPIKNAIEDLEAGNRLGCPITRTCGFYLEEGVPDILMSYKHIAPVGKLTQSKEDDYRVEIVDSCKYLVPAIQHSLPDSILVR
jgi:hypothetical protein